jgi:hypothetical protein
MKFFGYESHKPAKTDIIHEIKLNMKLIGVEGIAQMKGIFFDTAEGICKQSIHAISTNYFFPLTYIDYHLQ